MLVWDVVVTGRDSGPRYPTAESFSFMPHCRIQIGAEAVKD
jgi:hypothetical protein